MKFGEFGVLPERGRKPVETETVEEVATAVAERASNFLYLSNQSISVTRIGDSVVDNGATPHIERQVKILLYANFGDNRVISRHFPDPWSSRSPGLNLCDFWL
ncbi:hypothetical protein TNCV_1618241 [Trichonephila clavipes]|nr:hypothetical protein TNCV_1618241 [Trichonephila clavipes]